MQFDLKQADIYLVDGHANTGLINKVGFFAIGATTILIDGHLGIVVNGTTFVITGNAQVYTVSGHSETLGNTTSLTFSPSLVANANDNSVITFSKTDAGAVDDVAGYTGGETTITVDGFTGIIPIGAVVTIGSDPGAHVVTAHSETLGNTTSITFTIALAGAVPDDAVVTYTYTEPGAVNKRGTYTVGSTVLIVDGIVGEIPLGTTVTLGEDTLNTTYSITATVETLGNTTSITITPALVEIALDNEALTFGGRRLRMKIGDGTMSYDEKRAIEYKKDRGRLDTNRLGDEDPLEVKLDVRWEFLRSDAGDPDTFMVPTPEEVLKKVGAASDWVTTSEDPCEPYCINILVVYTPPCADVKREEILLEFFRYEALNHDFKQGMLSCSGKCNVTDAVVTRL